MMLIFGVATGRTPPSDNLDTDTDCWFGLISKRSMRSR